MGKLRMTNRGTGATIVEAESGAVRLSRVTPGGPPAHFEQIAQTSLYHEPGKEVRGYLLYPGSQKSPAFAFQVKDPGLYFVSFSAPSRREDTRPLENGTSATYAN